MRTVIFGKTGQVARCLAAHKPNDVEAFFLDRETVDFTHTLNFADLFLHYRPDIVINAVAYTNVERAEDEEQLATIINGDAVAQLGKAAALIGVPIIHISTDYVFDGKLQKQLTEHDPVGPESAYGRSKLAGENSLLESGAKAFIFRTAWVYSSYGNNFVKTMLRLAQSLDTIKVVSDQFGNPSSADEIAKSLWAIAGTILSGHGAKPGVYHLCGTGKASWYEFAVEIFELGNTNGWSSPDHLLAIPSRDYPTKVQRPSYSCLDTSKTLEYFGVQLPLWKESLQELFKDQRLRAGMGFSS